MAINKDAILKAVYPGPGRRSRRTRSRRSSGRYNNAVKDYAYDPPKAKELLAEAGYPNGFEVDLWYLPVTRPYNPDGKRMAELIQADWEKIGVKRQARHLRVGRVPQAQQDAASTTTMMFGWSGDNGDPDNFLVPLLGCEAVKGGGNVARWCNKEFDDLVTKAAQTPKQADAHQALRAGAGDLQGRGAVDHRRPFGALRPPCARK